jgi:hypothetical protein
MNTLVWGLAFSLPPGFARRLHGFISTATYLRLRVGQALGPALGPPGPSHDSRVAPRRTARGFDRNDGDAGARRWGPTASKLNSARAHGFVQKRTN